MLNLQECAQLRAQPRPNHSLLEFNKNTEVSDFSPYENGYREDVRKQNISLSNVEESDLKVKRYVLKVKMLVYLLNISMNLYTITTILKYYSPLSSMAELYHAWLLMCHWKRGRFVEILDVKTLDKYDVLDVSYGIVLKNVRLTIGKDISQIVKHHQH